MNLLQKYKRDPGFELALEDPNGKQYPFTLIASEVRGSNAFVGYRSDIDDPAIFSFTAEGRNNRDSAKLNLTEKKVKIQMYEIKWTSPKDTFKRVHSTVRDLAGAQSELGAIIRQPHDFTFLSINPVD